MESEYRNPKQIRITETRMPKNEDKKKFKRCIGSGIEGDKTR
jgi:hypothetical protein